MEKLQILPSYNINTYSLNQITVFDCVKQHNKLSLHRLGMWIISIIKERFISIVFSAWLHIGKFQVLKNGWVGDCYFYHNVENKQLNDDTLMMFLLNYANTQSWIFAVLAHWINSPQVALLRYIILAKSQLVFSLLP